MNRVRTAFSAAISVAVIGTALGLAAPAGAQSLLNVLSGDGTTTPSVPSQPTVVAPQPVTGTAPTAGGPITRGASPVDSATLEQQQSPQKVFDIPAPAEGADNTMAADAALEPFGADLFRGQFLKQRSDGINPNYLIQPGDQVAVRIWGALAFDAVLPVDAQGNIFIPEVGPVRVAGTANRNLNSRVRSAVSSVFTSNVDIYTNLMGAQRLSIFVTGQVEKPGSYAGLPSDSILYFLDQAGGVKHLSGSFRDVRLLRYNQIIARFDLYDFLLDGVLQTPQLREGDVLLVGRRESVVEVRGAVRQPAAYEFRGDSIIGEDLARLVRPEASASFVALNGNRKGLAFNDYISMGEFSDLTLRNGDSLSFEADGATDSVFVKVSGEVVGQTNFAVRRDATLTELLDLVEINPAVANLDAIYIKRPSVAAQQLKNLQDSLIILQRNALTATAATESVAAIRRIEADLITRFVEQARTLQPEGRVVVTRNGKVEPVLLEEGDEIIIPQQTRIVQTSGEVVMPKAIVHIPGATVEDYVEKSGGWAERAKRRDVVIIRANGDVAIGNDQPINPGDQIMVLPDVEAKTLQLTADITEILYRITIATAAILKLD
ncbi:MAG: polysaccharide biosynthesis/export family protein [Alphaproteobacteria bacterium]